MRAVAMDARALPLINYARNPSPRTTSVGWNGAGGTATNARETGAGKYGLGFFRRTWTADNGSGGVWFGSNGLSTFSPQTTITASGWVRPSRTVSVRCSIESKRAAGTVISTVSGTYFNCPANLWTRLWHSYRTPDETGLVTLTFYANGAPWMTGDTFDVSSAMITDTPYLTPYADALSPGWKWEGAADGSRSVGLPPADVRRLVLQNGPIYGDATGQSAIGAALPTPGPTGKLVWRIARVPGSAAGWGAYLSSRLPGATIPGGTPVRLSWWTRANPAAQHHSQGLNDSANQNVIVDAGHPDQTGDWMFHRREAMTLMDWVPANHFFRWPVYPSADSSAFLEISDPVIEVLA